MRFQIEKKIVGGFASALLLMGAVSVVSYRSAVHVIKTSEDARRSQEILSLLAKVLSTTAEAESGQRGFILTGEEAFLEPFDSAATRIGEILHRLRELTGSSSAQRESLELLEPLVFARLARGVRGVELRRSDGLAAARDETASLRGKNFQDEIRRLVAGMEHVEREVLAEHERITRAEAHFTLSVIGASGFLAVVFVALALIAIHRDLLGRRQAELLLREARDELERKVAERTRALAESEARLRLFIEHAPVALAMFDRDMRYMSASRRWRSDYHLGEEDIAGRSHYEIFPEIGESWKAVHRRALSGEVVAADGDRFERADGTVHWLRWEVRPWLDASGQVGGIVIFSEDITERKEAEEALRRARDELEERVAERTRELEQARDRAEAADRIKSAFLATMSHELRTPLNSIIGFTGILLQGLAGPLSEEQTKQLGMVQTSARHLLALINDVLDISKIEAGQLEVSWEAFDLRESLERATASVRPLAEKKGLALTADLSPELGEVVSDPRRVQQIVINLLNNAIKFTEFGGVRLTAEPLVGADSMPCVRIQVRDTGIGIQPRDLDLVFQPFRQVDTGLARRHEGTGLGLAICKRLADLLGAAIEVESEWGKGSVFTLILPREGARRAWHPGSC